MTEIHIALRKHTEAMDEGVARISRYRQAGLKWVDIAKVENIDRKTLSRKRKRIGYEEMTYQIDDAALDEKISEFCQGNSKRGERMIIGFILSEGYIVSRQRIRVDPDGPRFRQSRTIRRVEYCVKGPNHL